MAPIPESEPEIRESLLDQRDKAFDILSLIHLNQFGESISECSKDSCASQIRRREMSLLKLEDGELINFREDHYYSDGCETCDYGSSYVQDFTIETIKGNYYFNMSQMYEYPVSHEFMFKTILPNVEVIKQMTIKEFIAWITKELEKNDRLSSLRGFEIKTSFKEKV